MKIKALAIINNNHVICSGILEVHMISNFEIYVSWKLFADEALVAAKSEPIFFKDGLPNNENIINGIIERIENYRIGRKKIFKEVEMSV